MTEYCAENGNFFDPHVVLDGGWLNERAQPGQKPLKTGVIYDGQAVLTALIKGQIPHFQAAILHNAYARRDALNSQTEQEQRGQELDVGGTETVAPTSSGSPGDCGVPDMSAAADLSYQVHDKLRDRWPR